MYKKFSSTSMPLDSFSTWWPLYRFEEHPDMFVVFSVLQCAILRLIFHNKIFHLFLVCPCSLIFLFPINLRIFFFKSQSPSPCGILALFSIYLFSWSVCYQEFWASKTNHSLKTCQILNHKCVDLSPVAFISTLVFDVVIHVYEVLSNFICNGCISIDIAEGIVCCYYYRNFGAQRSCMIK